MTVTTMSVSAAFAVAVPVSAAVTRRMDIFTVEAFFQFLFGSVAYGEDFTRKVQRFSGHRRIEIHFYEFFAYFHHFAWNNASCAVHQRNSSAGNEKILLNGPVYFKRLFRKVYNPVRVEFSVTFSRRKGKGEFISRLLAFEVGLELVKQCPCSVNVVKRFFGSSLVDYISLYFKFVAEFYHFMLFYFHDIRNLAGKDTIFIR